MSDVRAKEAMSERVARLSGHLAGWTMRYNVPCDAACTLLEKAIALAGQDAEAGLDFFQSVKLNIDHLFIQAFPSIPCPFGEECEDG